MPNFALAEKEANALAAFLFSAAAPPKTDSPDSDASKIAAGKEMNSVLGLLELPFDEVGKLVFGGGDF